MIVGASCQLGIYYHGLFQSKNGDVVLSFSSVILVNGLRYLMIRQINLC